MKTFIFVLPLAMVLFGCTSISVDEVEGLNGSEEVCVVYNTTVTNEFRASYMNHLHALGYRTKGVGAVGASQCELISTYTATYDANWRTYLSRAEIKVYRNGELIGVANYRTPRSPSSEKNYTDQTIGKMVRKLFPVDR